LKSSYGSCASCKMSSLGVKDGVGELLISFIILASSASFPSQLLTLPAISAFVIVTVVGDLGGFGDDSVVRLW
nr:hypothetical protein [Tanacetum cinerariifolium]